VSFIDPLQELRTCRESVFIDYLHYTPSGNSFMAGVMYDRLKGNFTAVPIEFDKRKQANSVPKVSQFTRRSGAS
jgi:hypothetical protein